VRIGLNLLHALPEIGGGWNYISNLIARVGREDRHNQYVAFVNVKSAALVPAEPNFRVVEIPIPSQVRAARILYENTALQIHVWREQLDCLHWFANAQGVMNSAPAVVTIYDLQPFSPYSRLSAAKKTFLRWRLRSTVKSNAILLPMSYATAADLQQVLGAEPNRMSVIPPVLEEVFRPVSSEAIETCRRRYNLPAEFWLYVSHMYPHKNHGRLLEAYRAMKLQQPTSWPLVLRGDPQRGTTTIPQLILKFGLSKEVIILPRLDRNDLPALYGAASAMVFPSLYEGAGIPVLEAQACGCPVVASGTSALREFGGDAALYFDPLAAADICRAMMSVAADSATRAGLRERGLERARVYRETSVVERLLAAYKLAAGTTDHEVTPHAAA